MKHVVLQTLRGCGELPGVGSHPGTFVFLYFLAMAAVFGIRYGLVSCAGSVALMAIGVGPIYLAGAYSRAQISDRMVGRYDHTR